MPKNFQPTHGLDASMDISIIEYGLAWKKIKVAPFRIGDKYHYDYHFWYGIKTDNNGNYTRFDWADIPVKCDVFREFDWVDWDSFLSFVGLEKTDWKKLPLPQKIANLIHYYGHENIFGTSYTEDCRYNPETNTFIYD